LGARDGEIGHLKDFYFDDQKWTVRYLVADTGTWLPDLKVLLSPLAVAGIRSKPHTALEMNLTKQQIEQSPPIEKHMPVSRQYEARYFQLKGPFIELLNIEHLSFVIGWLGRFCHCNASCILSSTLRVPVEGSSRVGFVEH
jgi:hypothetical protein